MHPTILAGIGIKTRYKLDWIEPIWLQKQHSTSKLGLQIQSLAGKSIQQNKIRGIVSLDLSSAFDVVDHDLLFKRCAKMGLPKNIINILKNWLSERTSYVELNQTCSRSFKTTKGTIQGSVLGPILFSIFVSPIMDLIDDLLAFADDTYITAEAETADELKLKLQTKVSTVYDWFKNSGLVINEKKTDFLIFSKVNKVQKIKIEVGNEIITNKHTIKILGTMFDQNLEWSTQVDNVINRAKKDCHNLRYLSKFFTQTEMLKLASSLVFSRFYFDSVIWNSLCLKK